MAGNTPLYVRYTDENYVTKQGFFSALGSSLVEKLWDSVVDYRLKHAKRTNLRTASQLPIYLTMTEPLLKRYEAFESKLHECLVEYDKYGEIPDDRQKIERNLLFNCLKGAAELEGVKVSEPTLRAMISGIHQGGVLEQQPVIGYGDFLQGNVGAAFTGCEDFFVELYSAMAGTEELVTFYRVDDSLYQGRAGEYVKYNDIESLQLSLEEFVSRDPLERLYKAFLAAYFVDYVQPFATHNPLCAVALCKKILSRGPLGSFAYLLPLESIVLKRSKEAKEAFLEAGKSGDFTYVFLYWINEVTPLLEGLLNDLSRIRVEALKREFRSQMQPEVTPEPAPLEPVAPAKSVAPVEVPVAVPVTPTPVPPSPVKAVPLPEAEPEEAEIYVEESDETENNTVEDIPVLDSLPELSGQNVFAPKVSLNDKEVRMAARYIVETHPDINKQQATFFAAHCTFGRYYTIQDYKRTMKVAYETARTSMDRLATAKLYKKLRIKNKFVYTPRKPGEKE